MSAFAADVRPRSLSTGARPIKIEAICKKNRIRTNAVLRFAFAFLLKVSFERKAKRVFAQLFASKSWASREAAAKCTRSVLSRQGRTFRRKVTKFFCPTFCTLQKVGKSSRGAAERPRSGKGFNWVSAKFLSVCADSRFAEPRIFLWKGFNFVSGKLLSVWAESRFGKPRTSRQGNGLSLFASCKK